MMKNEIGEVEFEETGDELIDKWNREIAMGLNPDLSEGLGPNSKKSARSKQNFDKTKKILEGLGDGFVDKYDMEQLIDKRRR